jgi:hypothetical protein
MFTIFWNIGINEFLVKIEPFVFDWMTNYSLTNRSLQISLRTVKWNSFFHSIKICMSSFCSYDKVIDCLVQFFDSLIHAFMFANIDILNSMSFFIVNSSEKLIWLIQFNTWSFEYLRQFLVCFNDLLCPLLFSF